MGDNSESGFDKATLLAIAGGSMQLVRELVPLFGKTIPGYLSGIETGIMENDPEKIRVNAHGIKGMCLNMSAKAASEMAQSLENMGAGLEIEDAAPRFHALKAEIEKVQALLAEWIAEDH